MTIGLYGSGMHDFILREAEVGTRVAMAEDDEACSFGPLLDAQYMEWCCAQPDWDRPNGLDTWEF